MALTGDSLVSKKHQPVGTHAHFPGPSVGKKAVGMITTVGEENKEAYDKSYKLIDRIFDTRISIYWQKFFMTFLGNFLDAFGPLVILLTGGYFVVTGQTDVSTLVVFISGFQTQNKIFGLRKAGDHPAGRAVASVGLADPGPGITRTTFYR